VNCGELKSEVSMKVGWPKFGIILTGLILVSLIFVFQNCAPKIEESGSSSGSSVTIPATNNGGGGNTLTCSYGGSINNCVPPAGQATLAAGTQAAGLCTQGMTGLCQFSCSASAILSVPSSTNTCRSSGNGPTPTPPPPVQCSVGANQDYNGCSRDASAQLQAGGTATGVCSAFSPTRVGTCSISCNQQGQLSGGACQYFENCNLQMNSSYSGCQYQGQAINLVHGLSQTGVCASSQSQSCQINCNNGAASSQNSCPASTAVSISDVVTTGGNRFGSIVGGYDVIFSGQNLSGVRAARVGSVPCVINSAGRTATSFVCRLGTPGTTAAAGRVRGSGFSDEAANQQVAVSDTEFSLLPRINSVSSPTQGNPFMTSDPNVVLGGSTPLNANTQENQRTLVFEGLGFGSGVGSISILLGSTPCIVQSAVFITTRCTFPATIRGGPHRVSLRVNDQLAPEVFQVRFQD